MSALCRPKAPLRRSWALVLLLCLALQACTRPGPEAAIREAIGQIEQALSARDNAGVRALLAADFQGGPEDDPASLDAPGAQRLLAGYFLRYRHIGVLVTGVSVTPIAHDPSQAWSEATVTLAGAQGLLPESGRILKVRGLWRDVDGDWLLLRLTWGPLGGGA